MWLQSRGLVKSGVPASGGFLICALIAFTTGTSWGTYASHSHRDTACVRFSGAELSPLVLATLAAVAGGGCLEIISLSDTSILASTGAASVISITLKHPFLALFLGLLSTVIYLVLG